MTEQYGGAIPDAKIISLTLAGNHNGWLTTAQPFTAVDGENKYVLELDLSGIDITDNLFQFKLVANNNVWIGYTDVSLDAPEYVHQATNDGNFEIDLEVTGSRQFTLEATWSGGKKLEEGWILKITGDDIVREPYAVLADNTDVISTDPETGEVIYGKTLTFYYDDQKAARSGMSVGPFIYSYDPGRDRHNINSGWDEQRESITRVVFDESFANDTTITSTAYWFYEMTNLTVIEGLQYLNTQNVTYMYDMFEGCSSLTSLDLSSFNTNNVTDMSGMFAYCSGLISLDLSDFNTQNVTQMQNMFFYCSNLASLDLSSFDTQNVTDIGAMFWGCSGLTSLDLSGFNTQNVTNMGQMFCDCSSLTTIYVSSGWTTAAVTYSGNMFDGCDNLEGGRGTAYDTSHIDAEYARIDGGQTEPGYFTPKYGYDFDVAFDGLVLKVDGNITMQEAMEYVGGRDKVIPTLAAIVWNKDEAISNSDMQGIENPNLLLYVSNKALAPGNVKNIVVGDSLSGYKAQQITLTDTETGNGNFYCPIAFTASRITYQREFSQQTETGKCRGWETIVLPFTVQSIMHERNGQLRPFAAEGDGRPFWLRALGSNGFVDAKQMEANKPYIISMPNESGRFDAEYQLGGRVTFSGYNCQVPATSTASSGSQAIRFIPALSTVAQSDSVYVLNVGEEYAVGATIYDEGSIFVAEWSDVRPFHCYTQHTANSPAPRYMPLSSWLDGSTTDISEKVIVNSEEFATAPVYNLKGQRVMKPEKGLYIVDGKKVVVNW